MAEFVKVARVSDIPTGELIIVEVDGEEVALANVDGQIYAIGNECTHRGGPLGEGILEGDEVECPWHSGRFSVKTGEVLDAPPDTPVATYQVQVEGDEIKVAKG